MRLFQPKEDLNAKIEAVKEELRAEIWAEADAKITQVKEEYGEMTRAVNTTVTNMMNVLSPKLNDQSPFPLYHNNNPWVHFTPNNPMRKPGAILDTATLRRLADTYDILRSCINHLKREVSRVPIQITARDAKDETPQTLARIKNAEMFFEKRGGLGGVGKRRRHFEGMMIEDLCIIGATAIYKHPTLGGGLFSAEAIDAETIEPVVDAYGWVDPNVAYRQWVQGCAIRTFTDREMIYDGLYPMSYTPYFKSPVEYLVYVINNALAADKWNGTWLTDGDTPSDMMALPEEWTPDMIKGWQNHWISLLSGNTKERRRMRFVPSGSQLVGNNSRKDQEFAEFELWLLRRTCAIMGVQPASIGFTGEQYKTTQEESMGATSDFGAGILLDFRKEHYDDFLEELGFPELEVINVTKKEDDFATQADSLSKLVAGAIFTPNMALQRLGEDPIEGGDTLFVSTTLQPLELALNPPEPAPVAPGSPDTRPKADTDRNSTPSLLRVLSQWETKAINRAKSGKPINVQFQTDVLTDVQKAEVLNHLAATQETPEAIKETFATLRASFLGDHSEIDHKAYFARKWSERAKEAKSEE